jgi:gliding motility-associated-like protein
MGNGDTLNGKSIDYVYDSAGTYDVILTIFDGCLSANDTLEIVIGKGETSYENAEICLGDTLIYLDSTILVGGTYTIIEAVSGACNKTTILEVLEKDECPCEGAFPNVFTPNRDGMNDVFGMHEIENDCSPIDVREFKMTIFNRWGQMMFHTNNILEKWDGQFEGEDCPSEVYLVNYSYFVGDNPVSKSTDVTLIR